MSEQLVEVASGLTEGDRVVTTGAAALREGDKIILPGQGGDRPGGGQGRGRRGAESGRGGPAGRGQHEDVSSRRRLAPQSAASTTRSTRLDGRPAPWRRAPLVNTARTARPDSRGLMSIPRFAIHRPIMMAMISCTVILLGAISLTRLPVDLMPDIQQPTITVRMNYPGSVRWKWRSCITRPLEQALSATAGLEQINSNVVGRQREPAAEFLLGHRSQRGDERHAHAHRSRARTAAGGRRAADDVQVRLELPADHGPRRRGRRLRPRDAARAGRAHAVAAARTRAGRGVGDGERRAAAADPRRAVEGKDPGARPLGRSRRQHSEDGEPEHPARRNLPRRHDVPGAQPGAVLGPRSDPRSGRAHEGRRAGLHAGHRGGQGFDRGHPLGAADQRQAGRPDERAEAVRAPTRCRSLSWCAPKSSASTAKCRA